MTRFQKIAMGMMAASFIFAAFVAVGQVQKEKLTIVTAAGDRHVFQIEIASTSEEIEHGLMFRENMPADDGMLFLFEEAEEVSFWMKNTRIPLDMVFIAPDGKIIKIHENAAPHSLDHVSSEGVVIAVLEINGGRAAALGIKAGDRVELP